MLRGRLLVAILLIVPLAVVLWILCRSACAVSERLSSPSADRSALLDSPSSPAIRVGLLRPDGEASSDAAVSASSSRGRGGVDNSAAVGARAKPKTGRVRGDEAPALVVDDSILELPSADYAEGCETLKHKAYTVSYSRVWQQPRWVAYRLDREELAKRAVREDRRFTFDPELDDPTVDDVDYRRSGYDRGHMAPAGDMMFSEAAMRESFYFTNVAPQLPGFNRGVWSSIEKYTRCLAERYGSVWVVTGPSFHGGRIGALGHPPIPVASHFYKAYLVRDALGWRAAALMVPHQKGLSDYNDYWISIDRLERLVGLDFFSALPDGIEEQVEREVQWDSW